MPCYSCPTKSKKIGTLDAFKGSHHTTSTNESRFRSPLKSRNRDSKDKNNKKEKNNNSSRPRDSTTSTPAQRYSSPLRSLFSRKASATSLVAGTPQSTQRRRNSMTAVPTMSTMDIAPVPLSSPQSSSRKTKSSIGTESALSGADNGTPSIVPKSLHDDILYLDDDKNQHEDDPTQAPLATSNNTTAKQPYTSAPVLSPKKAARILNRVASMSSGLVHNIVKNVSRRNIFGDSYDYATDDDDKASLMEPSETEMDDSENLGPEGSKPLDERAAKEAADEERRRIYAQRRDSLTRSISEHEILRRTSESERAQSCRRIIRRQQSSLTMGGGEDSTICSSSTGFTSRTPSSPLRRRRSSMGPTADPIMVCTARASITASSLKQRPKKHGRRDSLKKMPSSLSLLS